MKPTPQGNMKKEKRLKNYVSVNKELSNFCAYIPGRTFDKKSKYQHKELSKYVKYYLE